MKINLKLKLLTFTLSIVILSNVCVGFYSFKMIRKNTESTVTKTLSTICTDIVHQVESMNKTEFDFIHSLASLPCLNDESIDVKDKFDQLVEIAKKMPEKYEDICLTDSKGLGYTNAGSYRDFSNASWYKGAINGSNFMTDPKYSTNDNEILMFYSAPVHNLSGKTTGVIGSVFKGDALNNIVKKMDIGAGYHPMIINRVARKTIADGNDGTNLVGQKIDEMNQESEIVSVLNKVCEGNSGEVIYTDSETKEKKVAYYMPINDISNWSVLCAVPYKLYYDGLNVIRITMISALSIAVAIIIIVGIIFIRILVKPLIRVKKSITNISTGNADLTKRIEVSTNDEIGDVVMGFNNFSNKLQTIISEIKNSKQILQGAGENLESSTTQTASAITEIVNNIGTVQNQIERQTSSVSETASTVNQIANNIGTLENMIENQSSGVTEASAAVEEMIGNIASVNQSVDKMANSFEQLQEQAQLGSSKQGDVNERVQKIEAQSEMLQEANSAIAAIAEQTNLLAMNAAIEAAHAGEAGKGFSVVADEIRKLSETSSQQSKTIGEQLGVIKESINQVVSASDEANQAFSTVSENIKETDQLVRQIKSAMEEQQEGSKQVISVLHSMNDSTIEVRKASQEMANGNKLILSKIQLLQDSTIEINSSMEEMSGGSYKIRNSGEHLTNISEEITNSIQDIGKQIDKFKV